MIKELCGEDYEEVRDSVVDSGWVNKMHTTVPGPDGKFGFGGACIPKDLNALSYEFLEINPDISRLLADILILNENFFRNKPNENQ